MAKPDNIRPISNRMRYFRWLNYAHPGTGKTVLAGSSPEPTLIIRPPMDHTDSLATQGSSAEEWIVDSWNEMEDVGEYLRHEGHKDYAWTWLDSISIFQDAGLDDVYENMLANKKTERDRQLRAQYGPDKGEYGVNMHRLAKWVRHFCALPTNIGITAHPFKDEDPDGDVLYMPWIQGKQMPEKICGYMNLVTYMTVREVKGRERRILLTERRDKFYGKDQFDAFNGLVADPTIPKLEQLVKEAQESRQKSKPKKRTAKKATARKSTPKTQASPPGDDVAWE